MRKEKPTGKEISEKSKKIKLDNKRIIEGEKKGKKLKFTPAKLPELNSIEEFEDGQTVGVIETEFEGDETNLPPGKYNIFISKVNDKWHGFAESEGKIKAEAARVSVEYHGFGERKMEKPKFNPKGWCITYCLIGFFGFCFVSIPIICF